MTPLTKEQKTKLQAVLKSEVFIACPTCTTVFLRTTAGEFATKFQSDKPSKEYLEAAKHWVETGHQILARLHGATVCLSDTWAQMAQAQNLTPEQIKQQLLEVSA